MSILCKYCNEFKLETDFLPSQLKIKSPKCKECKKENNKQYRTEHKEEIKEYKKQYYSEHKEELKQYRTEHKEELKQYRAEHKEEIKEYKKQYNAEHKEKIKEYYIKNKKEIKGYRAKHKEEIREYDKQYRAENKEELKEYKKQYQKNKYKTDIVFRLRINISRAIYTTLRKNGSSKNGQSILKYLPYTSEELKNYLELLFESWMNWGNNGVYCRSAWNENDQSTWVWNLDHIIPQTYLPYTSMEDDNFKICWALENLRPYNAKKNIEEKNNRSQEEIAKIKSDIKEHLEKLKILKGKE